MLTAEEATEAASRARHQWAARRVARLLKGLPDTPPLQAASQIIGAMDCMLTAGEATEAAFRARHRWAARRVAHLLKGLPDTPPLQAASEVIESASVNVGLKVEGQPFLGSTVDVVSASGGLTGNNTQYYRQ